MFPSTVWLALLLVWSIKTGVNPFFLFLTEEQNKHYILQRRVNSFSPMMSYYLNSKIIFFALKDCSAMNAPLITKSTAYKILSSCMKALKCSSKSSCSLFTVLFHSAKEAQPSSASSKLSAQAQRSEFWKQRKTLIRKRIKICHKTIVTLITVA